VCLVVSKTASGLGARESAISQPPSVFRPERFTDSRHVGLWREMALLLRWEPAQISMGTCSDIVQSAFQSPMRRGPFA
jgi:hypothetical protein